MRLPEAVFLVNLVQDVNVLRPLVFLAARETGAMAQRAGAEVAPCANPVRASQLLQGGRGILIAASESWLPNHVDTHQILQLTPPGYP